MFKRISLTFSFCIQLLFVGLAYAQTPPDALVRKVTDDVLAIVRADKAIQSGDTKKAIDLVNDKVLPHFNFRHMTALAVGRDWRAASHEQQGSLTNEFRQLLVRTYSNALTQYKDQLIEYKPFRMADGDTTAQVRTEVKQSGAQPVNIDYSLEKLPDGWKVYDVAVGGVSLVTNYRSSFTEEIQRSGIDGLIASLTSKNLEAAKK